jgi:hypothetical protein
MMARTRQGRSPQSRASTITSEGQIEVVVAAAAGSEAVVVVVVGVDVTASWSLVGRTELKVNRSCVPVVLVSAFGVDGCGWSS